MKQLQKMLALVLCLCMLLPMAPADAFATENPAGGTCGDNLTWVLEDGILTISGTGAMYDYCEIGEIDDDLNERPWEAELSKILQVVIGDGVTSVGTGAFLDCDNLQQVTISASVRSIGYRAVSDCPALEKISVSANNPNYSSDSRGVLFNKAQTVLLLAPKRLSGYYAVPDTVTTVAEQAFYECSQLQSVFLPNSVTDIGDCAFEGCYGLQNISIPNSVQHCGQRAFDTYGELSYYTRGNEKYLGNAQNPWLLLADVGDKEITSFTFDPGTRIIGSSAFAWCSALKSLTVPEQVIAIDVAAFRGTGLETFIWPKGAPAIGDWAFGDCEELQSIVIPEGVTQIGTCAFHTCTSLQSVAIPEGVTQIGWNAFSGCRSLQSAYLPETLTEIPPHMFGGCEGLQSIEIPAGVKTIYWSAFDGCTELWNVVFSNGLEQIGSRAFISCTKLQSIHLPNTLKSLCGSAFDGCDNLQYSTYENAKYLGNEQNPYLALVEAPGEEITACQIHPDTRVLCSEVFREYEALESITIPDRVVGIGAGAFCSCTGLRTITLPASLEIVEDIAFCDCENLTDVYYGGTEAQWAKIRISWDNEPLTDATLHVTPNNFGDVSETSWQYTHVKYALERNLMAGKGTDAHGRIKFDPDSPITREEFVQVLYNAEEKPAVSLANPFPDVKDNGWYMNAVLWAKKNDIANGGGDGRFGVGARITRQDLALMLYKYATLKNCSLQAQSGKINGFADGNKVASYAKTAMDWAVTNGILSGKGVAGQPLSTFKLDPTGTATRAECAAMLKNFMTAFGL